MLRTRLVISSQAAACSAGDFALNLVDAGVFGRCQAFDIDNEAMRCCRPAKMLAAHLGYQISQRSLKGASELRNALLLSGGLSTKSREQTHRPHTPKSDCRA
jgi:hypothetical protein